MSDSNFNFTSHSFANTLPQEVTNLSVIGGLSPLLTPSLRVGKMPQHMRNCHGDVSDGLNICTICSSDFPSRAKLQEHAAQADHRAFLCFCGLDFKRHDALKRHIKVKGSHSIETFECDLCNMHNGDKAFKRRDNLLQHLRGFHRVGERFLDRYAVRRGNNQSQPSAAIPIESTQQLLADPVIPSQDDYPWGLEHWDHWQFDPNFTEFIVDDSDMPPTNV